MFIVDIAASNMKGTCVIMRLSNFTHKNPQEVFDLYANVDSRFVKTKILFKQTEIRFDSL